MVLLLRGAFVLAVIAVWFYCVFDVIRSHSERVRNLHKLVWLLLVVFVPSIGSLAWLLLGRPQPLGSRFLAAPRPIRPPDDSPEFLAQLEQEIRRKRRAEELRPPQVVDEDQAAIDEEIRRLEEELRRRSKEQDGGDLDAP